jgi:uncharacterized protein (TIGR03067 family)
MGRGRLRNCKSAWLAVAVISALTPLSIADDATDKELTTLEGTWKFVSLHADGREAPADFVEKQRCVIRGKELTWVFLGRGEQKNALAIDPSKFPKAIDITPQVEGLKLKTVPGLYKLDNGRLTICVAGPPAAKVGGIRPENFDPKPGVALYVLERVKNE